MSYHTYTFRERPDLIPQTREINASAWAEFLFHDEAGRDWHRLFTDFSDSQILICDETDTVVGFGHTIPVVWDGTVAGLPAGWRGALQQGMAEYDRGQTPTTLSALAAVVDRQRQGQGLSSLVLRGMRAVAAAHGLDALIAPVRPTLKSRYPLTPMDRYIRWTVPEDAPFDPWLRAHWKLGARILAVAPRSMIVTGTVTEWEEWANMRFPESGSYIVPEALQPVIINCEQNEGRYEEDNVWLVHPVQPGC